MDSTTNTEDSSVDLKFNQENLLLETVKEVCSEKNGTLSTKLKGKVNRMIADCDLTHYSSLHKLNTADESTSTMLGLMHQTAFELTFDEQSELNQAIINKIQNKIPTLTSELESLKQITSKGKALDSQMKEIQSSIDDKLNMLEEQESEKVNLMMEWLNHRMQDAVKFSDNSSELLTLKAKVLELKSKILHLQILQQLFTETNQSIKAYSEVHKDLKDSIKETESRIKKFHAIIDSDRY